MTTALRPTTPSDLAWVTALERHPDNRELIGQWSDAEHLEAIGRRNRREHWIVECGGERAGYIIAFDGLDRAAGIYVKRILVADKEHGTGQVALAAFLDDACSRPGVEFVWLLVREKNFRAQAVYTKLGFRFYASTPEEAAHWDATMDPAGEGVLRMRLESSARRR